MLKEIAKFIRVKRAELNISQIQLAEMADVSLRSITKLEAEVKVRKNTLDKVVNSLGYKVVQKVEFVKVTTDEGDKESEE